MDNHAAYLKLSAGLSHAIAEHGAPNSFSPGELERYHCNVSPTTIGRLARGGWLRWIETEVQRLTYEADSKPCVFRVTV